MYNVICCTCQGPQWSNNVVLYFQIVLVEQSVELKQTNLTMATNLIKDAVISSVWPRTQNSGRGQISLTLRSDHGYPVFYMYLPPKFTLWNAINILSIDLDLRRYLRMLPLPFDKVDIGTLFFQSLDIVKCIRISFM